MNMLAREPGRDRNGDDAGMKGPGLGDIGTCNGVAPGLSGEETNPRGPEADRDSVLGDAGSARRGASEVGVDVVGDRGYC